MTVILFITGFLLARAPAAPPSGSGIDVLHYQVVLTPDLATRSIEGSERIEFKALAASDVAEFDCGELKIASVTDGKAALAFEVKERRLRVRWPARFGAGAHRTVAITYSGTPRFGMTFLPERQQVYTVFSTSQWMVAIDAPAERATFRLTLRLPVSWQAAGSGEARPIRVEQDRAVHEWHQVLPVPGYTYGFAAGRFIAITERHGPLVLQSLADGFSEPELRQVVRDTPSILDFFADRAGVPYGGRTYSQALTERGIGQEMAGLSVLPESYGREVLKDERQTGLAVHEAAHQWWGNMVTCRDWTHFWLNEGFATFMEAAYMEQRFGRKAYDHEIARIRSRYERVRDAGKDRPLVFDNWDRPTTDDRTIVYQKGAYVLHLLRQEIGDDKFWRGIREYTRRHYGTAVTTADLQAAMERASGGSLASFFTKWVTGPSRR
jgi:aminopeptidase N